MTDALFCRDGRRWHREWIGDNSGRYEWTTDDGTAVCWREDRTYRASVNGEVGQREYATLLDAMEAAERVIRRRAA